MPAALAGGHWCPRAPYSDRLFVRGLLAAAVEAEFYRHLQSTDLVPDDSRSASLNSLRKLNVDFVSPPCKIQTGHLIHFLSLEVVNVDAA
jgi:hypothetical protein